MSCVVKKRNKEMEVVLRKQKIKKRERREKRGKGRDKSQVREKKS